MNQFDILSAEFKANPFPTLARMREAGPVIRTKIPILGRIWMVTTYQAVNELLRDHRSFVRDGCNAGKKKLLDFQWWLGQVFRAPAENMLSKDEPDHRRLRGLVEDAFMRRSVDGMRDQLRAIADRLLDQSVQLAGQGNPVDFLNFSIAVSS